MLDLSPIETLYDDGQGSEIPLTRNLARLYGTLRFPIRPSPPYVISNFVSTVDGVVTLGTPGNAGGDGISGKNRHDSAVMGILRAASDAIIVGSKNLAASERHIWTAGHVFPELAEDYRQLRHAMGKEEAPLNVIVTARGEVDTTLPIFQSGKVNVLVGTTGAGAQLIRKDILPEWVSVDEAGKGPVLSAKEILEAVMRARPKSKIILVEGGPHLMGTFLGEKALDELFLTVSPQMAGRDETPERLGLVAGRVFAPDNPIWGRLIGVKRAENHLFLRYEFMR
jgi:riboflavin biosynthesis pyrimidine reductase